MVNLGNDWDELLKDEFEKEYYKKLRAFLVNEYRTQIIHPDMNDIFSALKVSSYKDTKILLLGQDPYHGQGQAHGMAFSVKPGIPALTVRDGQANSHQGKGWEIFTDRIIELLNEKDEPVIFILWGNNAKSKKRLITNPKHFIIEGVHPSPLSASRGFFGCGHFKRVNEILRSLGKKEIDWQIPNI